jgi:hypothetical protein
MPNKPSKYGLKYYGIGDVSTNYLLDAIAYLGKSHEEDSNAKECGKKMVLDLSRRFSGSNRVIGMDNYFTSIPLANELFSNQIGLIGTIKSNKNQVPVEFLASKEKLVSTKQFAFKGPLTLVSFTPKVFLNRFRILTHFKNNKYFI